MATTKPTQIPEWNTTGGNRTDPGPTQKAAGWAVNDTVPSSWWNWLWHYTGEWLRWFDERHFDGLTVEDYTIVPPPAAVDGGDMFVRGGAAATVTDNGGNLLLYSGGGGSTSGNSGFVQIIGAGGNVGNGGEVRVFGGWVNTGNGGAITIRSGGAAIAGAGGGVTIECNQSIGQPGAVALMRGGASDGIPGSANLVGGNGIGTAPGGLAYVLGGDAIGVNQAAGPATVSSGISTGNVGGHVYLDAAEFGGSGPTQNSPITYFELDGDARKLKSYKTLEIDNSADAGVESFKIVTNTVLAAPTQGAIYRDSNSGLYRVYNGHPTANYSNIGALLFGQRTTGNDMNYIGSGNEDWFRIGVNPVAGQIPANGLTQNNVLRMRMSVRNTGGTPIGDTLNIRPCLSDGTLIRGGLLSFIVNGNFALAIEATITIRDFPSASANIDVESSGHGRDTTAGIRVDAQNVGPQTIDTTQVCLAGFRGYWSTGGANSRCISVAASVMFY